MQLRRGSKSGAKNMRRNLHSRLGGDVLGQAEVRRALLAGVSAASLSLLAALATPSPACAQSMGGVGGAGLNPGGNGGGSNQNGGNGSTGATFGAKGVPIGGAGQAGTTGSGANASGGGGGGGAVGDTTTAGGAGGAGGAGVGTTPGGGGGGGGGGGSGYNSSFANAGTLTLTGGAGGAGGVGSGSANGGGGGGGGFGDVTAADINNSGTLTVTGGVGGAGGAGGATGNGGAGGAGGAGIQTSASFYNSALSISSTVTGGAGGVGGTGVVGGMGGAGGIGILITGNGTTTSTIVNQLGDSISGGVGGAGGSGAAAGLGGAGVSGSYMTVENLGAINGGGQADAIDFNGGTNSLSLGASQSMTGNVFVGSGATLTIDQTIVGANGAVSNTLAGAGPVTITTGAYTLTLSGDNTYTGGTTLTAGSTVIVGNNNAFGTNTVAMNDLSSLNFTGGVGIGNAITVTGDPDFSAAPTTTSVISGAITGTGSVTINNAAGDTGTIVFANTGNAYIGTTTVEAGELMGGVAGAFSAASATTVNSGAILDLGGFAQTIDSVTLTGGTIQNGSLTGAISSAGGTLNGIGGSASLEATASATPTLMEGSNTYTGATTVDSGATLSGADGANVFSAASATTVYGTLDLGGNSQTVSSLAGTGTVTNSGAAGTATLTNQGASSEFDGVIQDGATATTALTQNAPLNTLTLTGTNTYSGATTITAGTLALSGSGSIADSSGVSLATAAVFDISQTTAGASLKSLGNTAAGQTGTVYLGAQTLTLTGALTTFGGVIADAGGINNVPGGGLTLASTATGTETLTGVNTYTGATTINGGTLALSGTGSIALSSRVADNGTFDISGLTNGGTTITTLSGFGGVTLGANTLTLSDASSSFGGVISGTGGLTLTAGTERLFGANTYTGATNVDGGRLIVLGSIGSLATPSGPVTIGSGALLALRGSITTSDFTNSGTVYARGTLNAPVVNNSAFNVTGNFTGTTTFTNNPAAVLNVYNGTYALTGLLTNFDDVNIYAGGGLTAANLTNVSTGTIVNLGTVTDDLNNAGVVMNYGVYNANVASNTGTITNFASGAWNGNALNTGGVIENDGVWTGALTNMAGTLTNNGKIIGNVTASGGTVNSFTSNSAITGNVTLPGSPAVMNALGVITGNVNVMAGSNGVYGGIFRVGDDTGLLNPIGATPKTLTVNGSVSGPITMPVDLANGNSNYIKVTGSTANAAISLAGALTNPTNLPWTQVPNRTLFYSNASIPLTPTSDQVLAGASQYGIYDYVPTSGNNGIAQQLKLGTVSSPANQVSALVTALNTSFFQNASAFLGSPVNPTPNMWYGGVWSRGGGAEVTTETTTTGGGALYPSSAGSRFQTSLGGVQFGLDEGVYNINASGMNAHLGITGGDAWGYSTQNSSSDPDALLNVSGSGAMPFYGIYAAVTGRGFSGTVRWRHNTFDMNLNNTDLGLHNSSLDASGNTFSADAAYTIPLAYNFSATPSAAVYVSNTGIGNLNASPLVAPGTWFTFDNLNNTLFRGGLKIGTVYTFSDNLLVQPYVSGNIWHEFDGSTTTHYYQFSTAGLSTLPGIYSTGVGTFGQFAIGFSTQSPKPGFSSFVEADLQAGANLQGWGLTAGLRYSY
jgi:autotransporter-associated beta strand protein